MAVELKGLSDNARKTSISELNGRLIDSIALAMAVKQAHWNLRGPGFIGVHELLDTVHENLRKHVDTMAERVQVLDGAAVGTAERVSSGSTLSEYPTDLTKVEDHLRALCERYRAHGEKLRAAIDATDEAGDADTADLLTAVSRTVDKDLWFMSSNLA
ncbi:DNA starvation/stationary phase protection protein Dps [Paracoccus sediminis]|uniref:DNA starvation/stationary phase protection protein Dps n=1 Tax=Paracoccus sediminis TaxID=1214787 RepID=A0A238VM91_9RHOB|nr:DNA starvation/stationary phase protection protein Dps [Paracoccus sediminis]TBN52284.1 DNA starvation/stationary phase protection protein Dps [Paracoccus sediminis]SNR35237.1 starvation-inducible DNA-binding protein [Paracoccus sediminis]